MTVKKLSFEDFQKMLTEVEGKPVYRMEEDQFVLEWTAGSFVYQTIARFKDIQLSYTNQFPGATDDPIELFKKRYLVGCFEELRVYPKSEEIKLMETVEIVREGSISEFKELELATTEDGEKVVMGIRPDGTRGVLRRLGRFNKQ